MENSMNAEDIIELVCDHLKVKKANVFDWDRTMNVAAARHLSMVLLKKWCGLNRQALCKLFDRTPAVVNHAYKRLDNALFTKQDIYWSYKYLDNQVQQKFNESLIKKIA